MAHRRRAGGRFGQPCGGPTVRNTLCPFRWRRYRTARQPAAEDRRTLGRHFTVAQPAQTDYHLPADLRCWVTRYRRSNQLCGPSRLPIDRRNALPPRSAMMFQRLLVGVVDFCRRNALPVVLASSLLAIFAGWYAAGHLGINTDTDQMFASSLPWRPRAPVVQTSFPPLQEF